MKKNIKNKPHIPIIKKDLKSFLTSEEGKITKKNIVKLGMALFIASQVFQQSITKGVENIKFKDTSIDTTNNKLAFSSHRSHSSHTSHASHSSHGSHGSHTSHASHGSHASHSSHGSHTSHASHGSHGSHGSHASHVSHSSCCCGTTGYGYIIP